MLVEISYVNATKGHRIGDDPPHEPYTDDVGELFRFGLREFGRCVSSIYVDDKSGKARRVGWVFQRREQYTDTRDTYVREVWVTLLDAVTRTKHYHTLKGGV